MPRKNKNKGKKNVLVVPNVPRNIAAGKKGKGKKARNIKIDAELGSLSAGPLSLKGFKFKTGRAMVGLGTRAIDIQKVMPRLRSEWRAGVQYDIFTGTDYLRAISITGCDAGDILWSQNLSPSEFQGTRLRQFSELYQRYRFTRLRVVYEPIASATQSGQVIGYCDFDIDNVLSGNDPENISIAAAHQGQSINQIWQPAVYDMQQAGTFTDLYTKVGTTNSDDLRLSSQGVFYLLAASSMADTIPLGNIYIEYEIEFSIPYLSQTSSSLNPSWIKSWSTEATNRVITAATSPYIVPDDDDSLIAGIEAGNGAPEQIYDSFTNTWGRFKVQSGGTVIIQATGILAANWASGSDTLTNFNAVFSAANTTVLDYNMGKAYDGSPGVMTLYQEKTFTADADNCTFYWGLVGDFSTAGREFSSFSVTVGYISPVAKRVLDRKSSVSLSNSDLHLLHAMLRNVRKAQRRGGSLVRSDETVDPDTDPVHLGARGVASGNPSLFEDPPQRRISGLLTASSGTSLCDSPRSRGGSVAAVGKK